MELKQLNPAIPCITPKGAALAIFISFPSEEHNLLWTVCQDDTGEVWTWENPDIRLTRNITFGRMNISEIRRKL